MTEQRLYCSSCNRYFEIGPLLSGCPDSPDSSHPHALEVVYDYDSLGAKGKADLEAMFGGARAFWDYSCLLPRSNRKLTLGEGMTPLVALDGIAAELRVRSLHIKDESRNPTGSFKDRLNAVAVSMAIELGYGKLVTSTTGNHGVSLAAYGASGDLTTLMLCPPEASDLTLEQGRHYGAHAYRTSWNGRDELVLELVGNHGWYLSKRNDPHPYGNPFGVEGYKTIAYEIVRNLEGLVPELVFVPTCGGDSIAGIWKGFRELRELGITDRAPRMIACQPDGSPSLTNALGKGLSHVEPVEMHQSIAVSISDPQTGLHGLKAVKESEGDAVTVSEKEISDAVVELGRLGLCLEPSSAASLAGLRKFQVENNNGDVGSAVLIGTGSGLRWPWTFNSQKSSENDIEPTISSLKEIMGEI